MKMINWAAIKVLWLREMKRFVRAKSRLVGALVTPMFFLVFLGLGFRKMSIPNIPDEVSYFRFLVPGIIGMSLLFSSTFGGLSVLWDREFGFLKEIMVAPVSRISIVLGRVAGGVTRSLIQSASILFISFFLGFKVSSVFSILIALVFMILISITFLGLGLVFASRMKDMQGFGIVMNFVIFPFLLLSGAFYPIDNFPVWLRYAAHLDPLVFGIDGLRAVLIGVSKYPAGLDLAVMTGFALLMIWLGAYFFEKSESV